MNAFAFRAIMVSSGAASLMPLYGVVSPWIYLVTGSTVVLAVHARVGYIRAIRERERRELEGPR